MTVVITNSAPFDFDGALIDAEEAFSVAANQLSQQDRVVQDLAVQLAQAERARDELQREYDQAATQEETLMAYLGKRYDYSTANESPVWEPGE